MTDEFRGPDLKIHRAETHIIELNVLLKRFMDAQSYKVFADLDLEPGIVSWVARGEQAFPQDEFAPIIGDAIHNMRDALDLAVSALVRLKTGSDARVEFITRKTRDEFERTLDERAKEQSWPTNLVAVLKTAVEPYFGGHGHRLRILHDLAVLDKHRLIIPTVFGPSVVYAGVGGAHIPMHIGKPLPIKDGAVVATLPIAFVPSIKVGHEALISLAIAFDERCGIFNGRKVDEGLVSLLNATKEAIESMRECLPP